MRLLLIALLVAACQSAPAWPNSILFLVDDLGWQDTAVALTPDGALRHHNNTPLTPNNTDRRGCAGQALHRSR